MRYETGDALPYEWSEPVYGDVRHHRARIEQLKEWVRDWKARANRFEAEASRWRTNAENLEIEARRLRAEVKRLRHANLHNASAAGAQSLRADWAEQRVEELERENGILKADASYEENVRRRLNAG